MYSLITQFRSRTTAATEAFCFTVALLTAEFLFKFHSFILECAAFLALWFCLGLVTTFLIRRHGNEPAL
jgi:hypothetical protein